MNKAKSGEHEYFAGCALLAKMLKQTPGVAPVMARDGWPKKPETLAGAKAVVLFFEGRDERGPQGTERPSSRSSPTPGSIVHLHSAIDYPEGVPRPGEDVGRGRLGEGVLATHWVATSTPSRPPDDAGVTPFKIDDGWL